MLCSARMPQDWFVSGRMLGIINGAFFNFPSQHGLERTANILIVFWYVKEGICCGILMNRSISRIWHLAISLCSCQKIKMWWGTKICHSLTSPVIHPLSRIAATNIFHWEWQIFSVYWINKILPSEQGQSLFKVLWFYTISTSVLF